jgi:hypothetical protein
MELLERACTQQRAAGPSPRQPGVDGSEVRRSTSNERKLRTSGSHLSGVGGIREGQCLNAPSAGGCMTAASVCSYPRTTSRSTPSSALGVPPNRGGGGKAHRCPSSSRRSRQQSVRSRRPGSSRQCRGAGSLRSPRSPSRPARSRSLRESASLQGERQRRSTSAPVRPRRAHTRRRSPRATRASGRPPLRSRP